MRVNTPSNWCSRIRMHTKRELGLPISFKINGLLNQTHIHTHTLTLISTPHSFIRSSGLPFFRAGVCACTFPFFGIKKVHLRCSTYAFASIFLQLICWLFQFETHWRLKHFPCFLQHHVPHLLFVCNLLLFIFDVSVFPHFFRNLHHHHHRRIIHWDMSATLKCHY